MDASTFQQTRDTQLKSFQSMYGSLKTQYVSAVNNALKESDPTKRSTLIVQSLGLNKQIAALINSFSGTVDPNTCKQNPGLKSTLRDDLKKYNQDYESIQQGTSQLTGLQDAIKQNDKQTAETASWFSWYSVMVGIAIIVLIYMVVTRVSSPLNTQTTVSAVSGSLG